jgi:hypothetical protein
LRFLGCECKIQKAKAVLFLDKELVDKPKEFKHNGEFSLQKTFCMKPSIIAVSTLAKNLYALIIELPILFDYLNRAGRAVDFASPAN